MLIDCSHGNSQKDYLRQPKVCGDVCDQVASGTDNICGVMMESHLVAGRQDIKPDTPLTYGQSVTDACIDWETTVPMLENLARPRAPLLNDPTPASRPSVPFHLILYQSAGLSCLWLVALPRVLPATARQHA